MPTLGKSFFTDQMPTILASPPHNLRTAALSLDDLYHTHADLVRLAQSQPSNALLDGRGQPGTHDLQLAKRCFEGLAAINMSGQAVDLPVYDKSRHGGKGDRSERTTKANSPLDIVIFEGWAVGFQSMSERDLREVYREASASPKVFAEQNYGYETPFFLQHTLEDLFYVNNRVREYEGSLWKYIDCLIQLKPESMTYVWKWRLEVSEL